MSYIHPNFEIIIYNTAKSYLRIQVTVIYSKKCGWQILELKNIYKKFT